MEKKIEQLEKWVEELSQVEQQSPYLHVAIGGLRTAIGNLGQHLKLPPAPAAPAVDQETNKTK